MNEYFLSNSKTKDDKYIDIKQLESSFYSNLKKDAIVYLQGGDGTLNNFINNLTADYPNIILDKKGTGNDFSRMLSDEYQEAIIYIINNNKKFINGFGIGFDAEVCHQVNQVEKKSKLVYINKAISSLKSMNSYKINLNIDNKKYQFDNVLLTVIQSGKYIGNGMKITPNASVVSDDLNICVVYGASKLKFILVLPLVFLGLHTKIKKNVKILKGNEITGSTDRDLRAQCDGEVFTTNKFTIRKNSSINIKLI